MTCGLQDHLIHMAQTADTTSSYQGTSSSYQLHLHGDQFRGHYGHIYGYGYSNVHDTTYAFSAPREQPSYQTSSRVPVDYLPLSPKQDRASAESLSFAPVQ